MHKRMAVNVVGQQTNVLLMIFVYGWAQTILLLHSFNFNLNFNSLTFALVICNELTFYERARVLLTNRNTNKGP